MTSVLLNNKNELRNGWYLLVFLAGLALLLFPSVVTAAHYHHEITMFEQALMIMLITWACQCLRRKHLMEVIGTLNLSWLIQCALGMAIGSAMILAPALFLAIGNWITWSADPPSVSVVGSLLLTMFAVAVAEELLFRGFLFQRLEAGAGLWIAQIAMGGLFVLTHLGNPGMEGATKLWAVTNIFLASLLFGFAYLRTRSLAMPIGTTLLRTFHKALSWVWGLAAPGQKVSFVRSSTPRQIG